MPTDKELFDELDFETIANLKFPASCDKPRRKKKALPDLSNPMVWIEMQMTGRDA